MGLSSATLRAAFRKRRRAIVCGAEAQPLQSYIHPLSGAQLVMGRLDRKPYPVQGRYIAGWAATPDQALWFYRNFETERAARDFFNLCRASGPPLHPEFQDDAQVQEVYGWQNHFQFQSRALSIPEMEKVTQNIAGIFNINAPKIVCKLYAKKRTHAEALLAENVIKMYRPHLSMLLHEAAHLINDQVNQDKWVWHGPGFMRTYLSLLALFPQVAGDQDIEAQARAEHIAIADAKDVPSCALLQNWLQRQAADPKTMPSLI